MSSSKLVCSHLNLRVANITVKGLHGLTEDEISFFCRFNMLNTYKYYLERAAVKDLIILTLPFLVPIVFLLNQNERLYLTRKIGL